MFAKSSHWQRRAKPDKIPQNDRQDMIDRISKCMAMQDYNKIGVDGHKEDGYTLCLSGAQDKFVYHGLTLPRYCFSKRVTREIHHQQNMFSPYAYSKNMICSAAVSKHLSSQYKCCGTAYVSWLKPIVEKIDMMKLRQDCFKQV